MESTVANALLLLMIGMITVFIVLLLVGLSGKVLIKLINKYAPIVVSKKSLRPIGEIEPKVLAVVTSVVDQITKGKGVLVSVKKSK